MRGELSAMITRVNTFYKTFMWITTKRIVKSGFVNFWRNGFVSLASVLVMTVTLFVVGSLFFLNAILSASLEQIENKVDINVYFLTSAQEEDIVLLKRAIDALPEVASTQFTTRDEALARFEERHKNDQLTLQALQELGGNPLGASLSIKAKEPSQYEGIATFLEDSGNTLSQSGTPIIDKINYFRNKAAIDRLTNFTESASQFGLAITLVLVVASVLIVFNTIRLAIYTAREEIAVMRLVGASNAYIRGPFVFEGIMYGIISGFVTLIVFYPLTLWLGSKTESFFGNINIFSYYLSNFGQIFLIILFSGIILGALSSFLAVKKYLAV